MKATAPKHMTWVIGLIVGILGIVGHIVHDIPFISLPQYSYWLTAAGFIILALGTSLRGL